MPEVGRAANNLTLVKTLLLETSEHWPFVHDDDDDLGRGK
jgi:hypothetical protein